MPKNDEAPTPPDADEIQERIARHHTWLSSGGNRGERADLRELPLSNLVRPQMDLRDADLRGADLREANLRGVDLRGAQLQSAMLQGANLRDTKLGDWAGSAFSEQSEQRQLVGADLTGADLTGAFGLTDASFAGATLERTQLPEGLGSFGGVVYMDGLNKVVGSALTVMLTASLFSWLTITTTLDVNLLINAGTVKLPIIQTEISTQLFYTLGPFLLAAIYFNFLMGLHRLAGAMAALPVVFPDGSVLEEKSPSSLLSGFLRRIASTRRTLERMRYLDSWLAWAFGLWLVPLTLILFWGRYLCRHDAGVSGAQTALLGWCILMGSRYYSLVVRRLKQRINHESWKLPLGWAVLFTLPVALLTQGVTGAEFSPYSEEYAQVWSRPSLKVSEMREQAAKKVGEKLLQELRNPRVAAPIVCTACKPVTFPFLEVNGADLSKKPPDWKSDYAKDLEAYSGDSENDGGKLHSISGASLHTANLRYLKAQGAQLVRADLNEADLRGAFFLNAKLQSAVLNHAQASGAHFDLAYLQGASLIQANLRDATMLLVDLRNAKLSGADLRNADLTGAKLQGAVFYSDQLPPDLASAHLHGTILNGATYDATTKWPPGFDPKKAKAIKAGTPPGGSLTP